MSVRKWTEEQKKVIELKKRNILVSAAAGSGKTAVLVERIVNMVCDEKHPVDIDRLLVVTFTNAAAGEMRERVGQAIEERLKAEPENRHLQRQSSLLNSAQIMTIHSFCLDLIRNHFNSIHLDPAFRLAEEAELMLLKSDVLSEVLEEAYAQGEESFLCFVEAYAPGKTDLPIENLVLRLFDFSMSYPWPEEWLHSVTLDFLPESEEALIKEDFMAALMKHVRKLTSDAAALNALALSACEEENGPYMYQERLQADQEGIRELANACDSFMEYERVLRTFSFGRLSGKRDDSVDSTKRERVKNLRNVCKDCIEDIRKSYFSRPLTEVYEELQAVYPHMKALVDLTEQFMRAFTAEKEERNLLDFNDLEHDALKILIKDGKPTPVAMELREYYEEILIDEYQDSNQVQETLLQVISREDTGDPNRFMVGDVKQSIYKFRLARPELFMEKYASYQKEDSRYQRIDLHKNFRSRSIVLQSTNFIFEGIMHASLGNVEYDEDAALRPGAEFPEPVTGKANVSATTDILLIHDEEKLLEDTTSKELEAEAVAWKIRELLDEEFLVYEGGAYRPAGYGDMVILLRTMSGYAEVFAETLEKRGIPAYADTTTGYFSAVEVVKVLNFLLIIDNPVQDIPLAAVLHSEMGGMSNEELARIRMFTPSEHTLYESVLCYAKQEEDVVLSGKCRKFLELLNALREMAPYTSVYDLLKEIYERTGYYDLVSVLPGGSVRKGNLDMLLTKAADFERTSYRGLFHFNRYIEKLHQYEIDFGEAGAAADQREAVRIMSIHKSKGLEFPIVFLCSMMKRFNQSDSRTSLVLHPVLGIGPDLVNAKYRTKKPTLKKKVIQKCTVEENLGEELRVLYVAMTRAKEKLILTGVVDEVSKQMEKWELRKTLTYRDLTGASCYFDWVMPRLLSEREAPGFQVRTVSSEEVVLGELKEEIGKKEAFTMLTNWEEQWEEEDKRKALQERLSFSYPFASMQKIKSKMSVSELKKLGQEEDGMEELFAEIEEEAYVPSFAREQEEVTGASRGTIYHKVLEHLDFSKILGRASLRLELKRLEKEQRLLEKERGQIREQDLLDFLESPLGIRIALAQKEGRLHKETPFVLGKPASELYGGDTMEEIVLIQGIMDAYFEEGDGIVLMDYKTDHVKEERELAERYQAQMDYYQEALERTSGKSVKERWLYSFHLKKAVALPITKTF